MHFTHTIFVLNNKQYIFHFMNIQNSNSTLQEGSQVHLDPSPPLPTYLVDIDVTKWTTSERGYLLLTWAWKITCQLFDWMLQSSSTFSELKSVTGNLLFHLCRSQLRNHWKFIYLCFCTLSMIKNWMMRWSVSKTNYMYMWPPKALSGLFWATKLTSILVQ